MLIMRKLIQRTQSGLLDMLYKCNGKVNIHEKSNWFPSRNQGLKKLLFGGFLSAGLLTSPNVADL